MRDGLVVLDVVFNDGVEVLRENVADFHAFVVDLVFDFADGVVGFVRTEAEVLLDADDQIDDKTKRPPVRVKTSAPTARRRIGSTPANQAPAPVPPIETGSGIQAQGNRRAPRTSTIA